MRGSWTVFYNLTIASLLGTAGYIGSGENSVFALYQAAQPELVSQPAFETVELAPKPLTAGAYVPVIVADESAIVLASFSPAAPEPAPLDSPIDLHTAMVTGETVNLRLGPSTDFDKIGAVAYGDQLTLTGKTDGTWVQVQHPVDGSPVWISQKFIN